MSDIKTIHKRMLNNINDEYDKTEGSFFYDATRPMAIEFERVRKELDKTNAKFDVENLTGDELTRFVYQRTGTIKRKPATKATTTVVISGQEGAKIPNGDLVGADTINFVSMEDKILDATGQMQVLVECEEPGARGNVPAGAINRFPVSILGLVEIYNPDPVTNGYDEESDTDLRQRYYDKLQRPGKSGNKHHYLEWAKEIIGVGDAKITPCWNGPLTVKVTIIDANKQPANAELVAQVQEYIDPGATGLGEGEAGIGARCTVVSATAKLINIETSLVINTDIYTYDQIIENMKQDITEYLKSIAFKSDDNDEPLYVSYAKIGSIILHSRGVLDYSGLEVNSSTTNITVGEEEVAILGTVTII